MATAQETLMGNPITAAFAENANDNLDFAKMKYMEGERDKDAARQQGYAMAILGAKQSGEKDLEQMRNQAAMERTKESVRGYIDRLDEREKGKEMAKFKSLGIVPKPGEAADDFLARAATTHGKMIGDQANTIYGQIQANEQRANGMMTGEQQRLAGLAVSRAKAQLAPLITDRKLLPLLSSSSAEDVISKVRDPKDRAALQATWASLLETEQQKAQREVNPNVYEQARMIRDQNTQLAKRHAELLSSNPNASPFVKFDLPTPPETFEDALKRMTAGRGASVRPLGPPAPATAGIPTSFLGPLSDDGVFKIVKGRNPKALDSASSPTDIIRNTAAMLDQDIAAKQKDLSKLGVQVGPNGEPLVPEAEHRVVGPQMMSTPGGFYLTQPQAVSSPLSINERKRRHDAALDIIQGIQDAKKSKTTLQEKLDELASPASAVSTAQPDADAIFSGPAWPGGYE